MPAPARGSPAAARAAADAGAPGRGRTPRTACDGLLRPHVAHVLPLADAAKAHELAESGHIQGKIVLTL
ncbi:zinc-binding dehydrogenase [Actinomadura physcomitrii]|uniref:zinc-binding dehydrogenase n=1 Tax=Actinomadura physcomitrii TaxID=2650748 RepID=UPI0038B33552